MLKIHTATAGVLAGALLLTGCSTSTSEQKTVPAKDSASKTRSPKPSKTKRPKRTPSPSPTPQSFCSSVGDVYPSPRATTPRPTAWQRRLQFRSLRLLLPFRRCLLRKPQRSPACITRTVLKPELQVLHPYTGVNLAIVLSWIEMMTVLPANGLAKEEIEILAVKKPS